VTRWLLDTNVLSESCNSYRVNNSISLYVSVVTFAEIRFGIELVSDPRVEWSSTNQLRPMFEGRVLSRIS
jgi:predicted nucleic acid-binding protein